MNSVPSKTRLFIAFSLLALCTSFALAVDDTFFGIELNAALNIPECQAEDFLPRHAAGVCEARRSVVVHPWGVTDHTVRQVGMADQRGIDTLYAIEYRGTVVEIDALTYGETAQDEVLKDLKAKFGAPAMEQKIQMPNAFRAHFPSIVARWQTPTLTVRFRGMTDSRKSGEVKVLTHQAQDADKAYAAWSAANGSRM